MLATAVPGLQSSSSSVHPCSTCPKGLSSHDLEYRQHWAHDAQVWGDYKTYYLVRLHNHKIRGLQTSSGFKQLTGR